MALGDIITNVIDITGRPDKEVYMRAAIDSLVRMLAGIRDNPLSLVDAPQTVDPALLVHSIPAPADLREVAYIRPSLYNALLTRITPQKAFRNGVPVVNCYYRSGNNILVNLQQGHQVPLLQFGYYAHPAALSLDTDTNWVVQDYQDILIDLLSAKVLRVTGDVQSANGLESGVKLRIQQLMDYSVSDVMV